MMYLYLSQVKCKKRGKTHTSSKYLCMFSVAYVSQSFGTITKTVLYNVMSHASFISKKEILVWGNVLLFLLLYIIYYYFIFIIYLFIFWRGGGKVPQI